MIAKGFAETLLGKLLRRLSALLFGAVLLMAIIATISGESRHPATAAMPTQATQKIWTAPSRTPTLTLTATQTPTLTASQTPSETPAPSKTATLTRTATPTRTATRTPIPPTATLAPTMTIDYLMITRTAIEISINALGTQTALDLERKQRMAETTDQLLYYAGLVCVGSLGMLLFGIAIWVLLKMDWRSIWEEAAGDDQPDDLVRVEITEGNSTKLHKYEVPRPILRAWADAVLQGRPLGVNSWTGARRYFERDTSRPERDYKLFIEFWFKHDIIRRVNPDAANSRIEPTERGRVVLEKVVKGEYLPQFPLPTAETVV